jgi:hypothetical protein
MHVISGANDHLLVARKLTLAGPMAIVAFSRLPQSR